MCGEQAFSQKVWLVTLGSPPRVRGTVQLDFAGLNGARITPACAGNSSKWLSDLKAVADHPRVCGEQMLAQRNPQYREGSPPRVRGTGLFLRVLFFERRITPACAGNRQ